MSKMDVVFFKAHGPVFYHVWHKYMVLVKLSYLLDKRNEIAVWYVMFTISSFSFIDPPELIEYFKIEHFHYLAIGVSV